MLLQLVAAAAAMAAPPKSGSFRRHQPTSGLLHCGRLQGWLVGHDDRALGGSETVQQRLAWPTIVPKEPPRRPAGAGAGESQAVDMPAKAETQICAVVVIRFGLDSNDVRPTVKLANERISTRAGRLTELVQQPTLLPGPTD